MNRVNRQTCFHYIEYYFKYIAVTQGPIFINTTIDREAACYLLGIIFAAS